MKTFNNILSSLKSTLLVTIFLFTCVGVWGGSKTCTVTSNKPSSLDSPVTIDEVPWTYELSNKVGSPSTTATRGNYSSTYGLKFGTSSSSYFGTVKFSTSYFSEKNITSVVVNVLNNGSKAATMTVKQGDVTIGSVSKTFGNSYTNLTANTNKGAGGTLEITYEVAQASCFHSFTITYEDCADPTDLSVGSTTKTTQIVTWSDENGSKWDVFHSTSSTDPESTTTPTYSGITEKSCTISDLIAGTTYNWWVRSDCGSGSASAWVKGTPFTTSAITYTDYITECGTDPFISVSPTTIEGLGYVYGSEAAASTVKTFTVTGNYLNSNVTVTAPTGFDIKTGEGQFTTELTLTPSDGSINAQISVRLSSGATAGNHEGNVTIVSTGSPKEFADASVALSATVTPAQLATPVVTATPAVHQITLSWAEIANADSYSIVCQGATIGDVAVSEGTCTCVLSGLTGGQSYTYNVKAIPADGDDNHIESETSQGQATAIKATYAVTWYVNGSVLSTENVEEGATATTPANPSAPAACSEKVFTGWTEMAEYSSETTAPEYVSTPVTVTDHALNLYAVFADQGGEPEYYVKGSASDLTAGQVVVIHDYTQNVVLTTEGYSSEKIPCVSVTPSNNKIPVASITDKMKWTVGVVSGKYTFSQGSNYLMAADWYLKFGTTNITQWTLISMSNGYRFSQSDESDYPYINNDKSLKDITSYENSAAILNVFIPLASYSHYTTTCAKIDPELTGTAKTVAVDVLFDVSTMFTSNSTGTITYSVTSAPASAVYELDGKDFLAYTAGDYTIKASQVETGQYLADEATAVLTVSAKTAATLKLSAIGNEYDFEDDDLYVTKEITLPDDVEYKAANKTFVGWSSETIPDEGAEPTTNYYAKGSKYTIAKAEDKLYAVYATETEGAITWSVATTMTGMQAGDILAFACINDNNSVANGNKPDEKNFLDSVNITVANDIVTAGAEKIVPITLGGDAENGWNMNVKNLGYIYRSAKNEMGFKDTPTAFQSISIDGTSKEATVKVSGDSIVMYNSGSPRFSIYKSGQTAIKLLKAAQGASTFSKYTTSGTLHVDAPTFAIGCKPGTYAGVKTIYLNVADGTTVYYTIDGTTEPTKSSTLYNAETGFNLSATATIKAKAFIGENASALLEGTFTIHNYNSIDALLTNALNADATLNVTDAYIHKVYAVGPHKQVFIQEASGKGIILATSAELPEGIVAGNKLTAAITGYCKINNGRPQLGTFTLADGYTYSAGTRPEPTVLTAIDETTVGANLLKLVKVENIYTIEEGAGNLITMNANALGTGTAYTVYDIWNNVNVILPVQTDACNVIGLFNFDGTTYSVMPLQTSDFAVVDPQDATLPTVNPEGGATSATAVAVATGEGITITPADGFSTAYKLGEGAKTDINKETVVNINETTSLTVYASRPYFNDAEKVYYYIADPSLIKYTITLPSGLDIANGKILSDVSTAAAGATVTLTPEPKEHYTLKTLTVSYENEGPQTCELTGPTAEGKYTFVMPAFNVVVSASWQKDPTYSIEYQTGGKQTTSGSAPTEGVKFAGDEVTLKPNTWTVNNFVFDRWKVIYETGEGEQKEEHVVTVTDGKFTMPAHDVKIIAQWTPTYTVTYDKGSATSATGSVTEDPQIEGAKIIVKANGFSAPGYTFTGWKANTTGDQIYQAGDEYIMTAAAVTFTAQWDEPIYTKPGAWELVKSVSELSANDYVIFASASRDLALGAYQTGNKPYYTATNITKSNDGKLITDRQTAQILKIESGNKENTWAIYSVNDAKYVAAASSSDNMLTEVDSKASNEAAWSIAADGEGKYTIDAQGTYSRNRLREFYQSGQTGRFNCYGSTAANVSSIAIYKYYRLAYSLSYDDNVDGEVIEMPATHKADPDNQSITITSEKPNRPGWNFTYWSVNKGTTGTHYEGGEQITLEASITLYAHWEKASYNVAVANTDNAVISAKVQNEETTIAEGEDADVLYQKYITLSCPADQIHEDYFFNGWVVTKADDPTTVVSMYSTNVFQVPAYDVNVTANIASKAGTKLTLTYNANGGGGDDIVDDQVTYNTQITAPECTFTHSHATFSHWNTQADNQGDSYNPGQKFTMKNNVTLYAQWTYTGVTYHLNKDVQGNVEITSGEAPAESTFSYTQDNSTVGQATANNPKMTLTLTGFDGKVITGVIMKMHTNKSSGAGAITVTVGNKSAANTTYLESFGNFDETTDWRTESLANFKKTYVESGEQIIVQVVASVNSLFLDDITIQYTTPDYTRSFTNHNVSTICVDHEVAPGDRFGASFYEIAYKEAADDLCRIFFDEVAADEPLVAGKPYVIIPEGGTLALLYSGSKVNAPVAGEKGLTGTFTDIAAASGNILYGNYIFSQNKYWFVDSNCSLAKNRAYIQKDIINADFTPVAPVPGRRRIVMGANGIEEVTTPNTPTEVVNVNVNENAIQKLIINNQLIIIRGGKMYNAAGALVK